MYVEAAVSTSCSNSTKVKYAWSILDQTGKHVVLEHGGDLSRKNLVLPAGTLSVGLHRLLLKVRSSLRLVDLEKSGCSQHYCCRVIEGWGRW